MSRMHYSDSENGEIRDPNDDTNSESSTINSDEISVDQIRTIIAVARRGAAEILRGLRNTTDSHGNLFDMMDVRVDAVEQRVDILERALEDLDQQLDQMNIRHIRATLNVQGGAIQRHSGIIDQNTRDIFNHSIRVSQHATGINNHSLHIQGNTTRINDNAINIQFNNDQIQDLLLHRDSATTCMHQMDERIGTVENSNVQTDNNIDELRIQVGNLNCEATIFRNQHLVARQEIAEMQETGVMELQSKLDQSNGRILELEKQLEAMASKLNDDSNTQASGHVESTAEVQLKTAASNINDDSKNQAFGHVESTAEVQLKVIASELNCDSKTQASDHIESTAEEQLLPVPPSSRTTKRFARTSEAFAARFANLTRNFHKKSPREKLVDLLASAERKGKIVDLARIAQMRRDLGLSEDDDIVPLVRTYLQSSPETHDNFWRWVRSGV